MAMKIFLDTNIFLSVLNQESSYEYSREILKSIHRGKMIGFTSVLCISEILAGFYVKGDEESAERALLDILSINNLKIVEIDLEIAKEGGKFRGKYKIKLPDALIASTCFLYDATLVTIDESFERIKEINVFSPNDLLKRGKY